MRFKFCRKLDFWTKNGGLEQCAAYFVKSVKSISKCHEFSIFSKIDFSREFNFRSKSSSFIFKNIFQFCRKNSKLLNEFSIIFSKMDGQQYCLKWNHHQSNLLKVFSRLLGNEQFTDVLLATESKSIRCHKVVLSACSSYFEHLFLTFDEKNQIIILKDTSYDDILALVEFMYRGEINVGQVSYNKLIAWTIFFLFFKIHI